MPARRSLLASTTIVTLLLGACVAPDRSDLDGGASSPEPKKEPAGLIVFSGDDGEIHVFSLATGTETRVTDIEGDRFDADGHGRLLVFRDSRFGVNDDDEIYVVSSDGSWPRNLTNAPESNEWGPAWSPDGTQIAFSSDREGMPQIFVMEADGGNTRRVSEVEGEYPTWSPDGAMIAFASSVGGSTRFGDPDYDIFVMSADGADERNITNADDSYDMYPTWSPDGEWIAFESTMATPKDFEPPAYDRERISDFDVWVMRPDGTGLRNLTGDLETLDKFPDWSPDGEWIVFDREGAIVVMSPDGSTEIDVSRRTGVYGNFPAWVA